MAEFGRQEMVPTFRANSSHLAFGPARYVFVAAAGQGRAVLATDPTASSILGVAQNNPDIGEALAIAVSGVSKVVAGAAIAANAIITTNASGRAVTVASGQMACGRALEAAGANGHIITAMLFHPVRWAGAA